MSVLQYLKKIWVKRSKKAYLNYLKKCGIKIGAGTVFYEPRSINIDISRPELLEIGSNVFIHRRCNILTHDWAGWCFVNSHKEFYPSHAKVKIGNNVWFGENVSVCKGVSIGDNCIIGIGSVVTKSIPDNCVAAGIPARVLCSYEEYVEKRSKQYVQEAIEYAQAIFDSGREPVMEDFYDDYPCFVDGSNYKDYPYPYMNVFNTKEQFEYWCRNHKKVFKDFKDFMRYVKREKKQLDLNTNYYEMGGGGKS